MITQHDNLIGRQVSYGDMANPRKIATIVKRNDDAPVVYSISQNMKQKGTEYTVVFNESLRITTMREDDPEGPGGWQWEGEERLLFPTPEELLTMARGEQQKERERLDAEKKRKQAEAEAFQTEAQRKKPAWAKAVIVAEYEVDKSDSSTDYFATTTDKRLILAWSKHTRDLFPEMRKAAENAEETMHLGKGRNLYKAAIVHTNTVNTGSGYRNEGELARGKSETYGQNFSVFGFNDLPTFPTREEAQAYIDSRPQPVDTVYGKNENEQVAHYEWRIIEESIEHREKYSMGSGYYLKAGLKYTSGWRVLKYRLGPVPMGEWRIPETKTTAKPQTVSNAESTSKPVIRKGTKPGYIEIQFDRKPCQAERDRLKSAGFRWAQSKGCWYGRGANLGLSIA